MKKILLILLIAFCGTSAMAQDSLGNMEELKHLLKQRKDQFETYSKQAAQRSGIFGNQTKKDFAKSREILLQIVSIDNQIMDKLNQAIINRGMAKGDYVSDELSNQQTIQQLSMAADTLEKQLNSEKLSRASYERKSTILQFVLIALSVIVSIILVTFLLKGRK